MDILKSFKSFIIFDFVKNALDEHKRGKIGIYNNNFDLAFNFLVYVIPLPIFFTNYDIHAQATFYFLCCICFTILMGIDAYQNNISTENFLYSLFIKICIGLSTVISLLLILLFLLIASQKTSKGNRRKA